MPLLLPVLLACTDQAHDGKFEWNPVDLQNALDQTGAEITTKENDHANTIETITSYDTSQLLLRNSYFQLVWGEFREIYSKGPNDSKANPVSAVHFEAILGDDEDYCYGHVERDSTLDDAKTDWNIYSDTEYSAGDYVSCEQGSPLDSTDFEELTLGVLEDYSPENASEE